MTTPNARSLADATDDQLVEAAREGDRRATEQLLRRHHDRILLLCRRLCRDRGEAEDAAQNALIAIVRGLPRFDGSAAFTTWSYRVATNACLDELRRRGRRPVPEEPGIDHVDHAASRGAAPLGQDPADAVVAREETGRLQRALDLLPEEFRQAVVLRDVADLDYAQIGEVLDLPPGTVRSRIARGRARLLKILSESAAAGNPTGPVDVGTPDEP